MLLVTEVAPTKEVEALFKEEGVSWSVLQDAADCAEADGLLISGHRGVPKELYEHSGNARVVGMLDKEFAGIDIQRLTRAGVTVLAPHRGEAASVAEFAFVQMLQLARKRKNGGVELKGKTLGLLGFGANAAAIAERAAGFGMNVCCYDRALHRGRALRYGCDIKEMVDVLVLSDFVCVTFAYDEEVHELIGKDQIQLMKKDAALIHLADPRILRWQELVRAIDWGYLAQFAIDLPLEYQSLAKDLARYDAQTFVTVNTAADTNEARRGNFLEMAGDVVRFLRGEVPTTSINVPQLQSNQRKEGRAWSRLAFTLGSMMGQRLQQTPLSVHIEYYGSAAELEERVLEQAMLAGLGEGIGAEDINFVNSRLWADEAGIAVQSDRRPADERPSLRLAVNTARGRLQVAGQYLQGRFAITQVDNYHLQTQPNGHLLLLPHANRSGIIGRVGNVLGEAHINIVGMVLGHETPVSETALMWVMLDRAPDTALLEQLKELPGVFFAEYIHIADLS